MTSAAARPALEARSVSFRYSQPVLEDFSLALKRGEVTGIIGPNGCGKTTALRLLDGILEPLSGEVVLEGERPLRNLRRREIAQHIAMVPQNGTVLYSQTVFEFAMHGRAPRLSLLGFEQSTDEAAVREALVMTRLSEMSARRVSEISGGEKQRLLLARALAQQAVVLLVDELTANLDVNFQVELMRLVRDVTRNRSLATLVVSHEINLLAAFADRIVLLSGGRTRGCGAPADVLTEANLGKMFGLDFSVCINNEGKPEILPVMSERNSK
jgi:iron complex transport system ATP-binding protein